MPCSILRMQIIDVASTWKQSCSHVKIVHNFSIQSLFISSLHSHEVHSAGLEAVSGWQHGGASVGAGGKGDGIGQLHQGRISASTSGMAVFLDHDLAIPAIPSPCHHSGQRPVGIYNQAALQHDVTSGWYEPTFPYSLLTCPTGLFWFGTASCH